MLMILKENNKKFDPIRLFNQFKLHREQFSYYVSLIEKIWTWFYEHPVHRFMLRTKT